MFNWVIGRYSQTIRAAGTVASTELLASIDLFIYIRALQRRHVEELIGGTEIGQIATVALSRCLVEHAWLQLAPETMPAPPQLRQALHESWSIFSAETAAKLDACYRAVAARQLAPEARLALAQLEHWSEAAVARRFAEHTPVRSGWLSFVFAHAIDDADAAATALKDFPVAVAARG